MRRRDPLTTHNERMKMIATTANAVGLGVVGFAVIRPLVESFDLTIGIAYPVTVGLLFHLIAHYVLRYIETEDDL